ncbi:MAG: hypothetical protein R2865_01760 [Deinococcales bacterium]
MKGFDHDGVDGEGFAGLRVGDLQRARILPDDVDIGMDELLEGDGGTHLAKPRCRL